MPPLSPSHCRCVEANKNRVKGMMEAMKWTIMHRRTTGPTDQCLCLEQLRRGRGMGDMGEGGSERGEAGGGDVTTKKVYRSTAIDAVT